MMPTSFNLRKELYDSLTRGDSMDISHSHNPYYNTRAWHITRYTYIKDHPLCERCLQLGRSTPAQEVHHIKPFTQGITNEDKLKLLQDPNNLMSLCKACHDEMHRQIKQCK